MTFATVTVAVAVLVTPIPSRSRYVNASVPKKLAAGV